MLKNMLTPPYPIVYKAYCVYLCYTVKAYSKPIYTPKDVDSCLRYCYGKTHAYI